MTSRLDGSVLDVFFRCLADSRRRVVLSHLLYGEGSATFDELVDRVVEAETHSPSPDRRAVEVSLAHNHLPLLAERGLVEYDGGRGVVTTTDRTDQIQPYLSLVDDLGPSGVTAEYGG